MNSFCVCLGCIGDGYLLVKLLGVDDGYEVGSIIKFSDGILYGNLEGYPLGEWKVGVETRSEVRSSGVCLNVCR